MLARIEQFADVMQDSKQQIRKGLYHQAIFGDLNTMAHGIARFSPKYCNDKMRFWTLGQSEAAFWDRTVFSIMDPETIPEQDNLQQSPSQVAQGLHDQHTSSTPANEGERGQSQQSQCDKGSSTQQDGDEQYAEVGYFPHRLLGPSVNGRLQKWGLPLQVCQDIVNPGFRDPFDPVSDITLDHPSYRYFGISLMAGKLDWLLLRKMKVMEKSIGNHDYSASDHKWLSASVQLS